jgi:NADH-quinone oxidoreductase subunit E
VMVNWEFFDNQTPESAVALVDDLRSGDLPMPTRGASLCSFKQVSRILAGFPDGRADEGPSAGAASLAGLRIYREEQSAGRRRKAADDRAASAGEEDS